MLVLYCVRFLHLFLLQLWVADSLTHQLSNSVTLFHWETKKKQKDNHVNKISVQLAKALNN